MNSLKIFLTFDHELPLGGLKSTYEKAMFAPTAHVLQLAEQLDVKVTLFTDVLCALRFKEWDHEGFYKPYVEQIHQALAKGHDVQLHLHPHWLTSRFENGTFIPSADFKLSDFKTREEISNIIKKGCDFLRTICREANQDYQCVAYRGGGYNISPASDIIFSELIKNGIRFDSSICKGYYFKSALSEVNFYGVPALPNWYIGEDGDFRRPADSGILEIPIAGKTKSLFEKPTRFKMKRYLSRAPENRGKQIHEEVRNTGLTSKIRQAFSSRMLSFDNYTYSPEYLMSILDDHVRKYSGFDTILLSAVGHPKSMGDYSLHLMKEFVEKMREKYKEKVEFLTYEMPGSLK